MIRACPLFKTMFDPFNNNRLPFVDYLTITVIFPRIKKKLQTIFGIDVCLFPILLGYVYAIHDKVTIPFPNLAQSDTCGL